MLIVEECLSNKCIAMRLSISEKTVEAHRAHAIEKLKVRSTTELCKHYWQWLFTQPGPSREDLIGA